MMTSKKRVGQSSIRKKVWKKSKPSSRAVAIQTDSYSPPLRSYPLGRTRKVEFVYGDSVILNAGSGTGIQYLFSCNSCYDPDRTGTGTQPRGFDELMALFDHGTVISARLDAGIYNTNAGAQLFSIGVRDTVVTTPTFKEMLEQPQIVWTHVPGTEGGGCANLTMTVNPNKFLGRSKPLSEDSLRFSASSNPSEECFFVLSTGDISGGDPGAVYVNVRIVYTCILTEPKHPTAS